MYKVHVNIRQSLGGCHKVSFWCFGILIRFSNSLSHFKNKKWWAKTRKLAHRDGQLGKEIIRNPSKLGIRLVLKEGVIMISLSRSEWIVLVFSLVLRYINY